MPFPNPGSVVAFLDSIAGKHAISGQFTERGPLDPIENICKNTGKWLGLIGGDYWWYGEKDFQGDHAFNNISIPYWQAGGLITISCSMPNPTTGGAVYDVSSLDVNGLLTRGTVTNSNFMKLLDSVATGLQQLQKAGVVVIWRPFHEMNGDWFWWGSKLMTASQFVSVWQYVHNYMTNNMGLNNIVWLWAMNAGGNLSRYPGKDYVDIVGQDLYTSHPTQGQPGYNLLISTGKPIVLAEFGPGDASKGDKVFNETALVAAIRTTMPKTVFWQQWWDGNAGNVGWGMGECQGVLQALNDPWLLNRGELSLD